MILYLVLVSCGLCAACFALSLLLLVLSNDHRVPCWLEAISGFLGVVILLGAIVASACFTLSHWEMSRLALFVNYPLDVLGIVASMVSGRVLLLLAGFRPTS